MDELAIAITLETIYTVRENLRKAEKLLKYLSRTNWLKENGAVAYLLEVYLEYGNSLVLNCRPEEIGL